jgi:RNA recognition motif-containing protein
MATKLFVGNLAYKTTDDSMRAHFEQAGAVADAKVIMERDMPNRSRGFGFVTMADEAGFEAALKLDKSELDGRPINVSEAQERAPRPAGNGYGQGGFSR